MSMRTAIGVAVMLAGAGLLVLLVDAAIATLLALTTGALAPTHRPLMTLALWRANADLPGFGDRLVRACAGAAFLVSLGIAMVVALLRKRSLLHGNARFATRSEVEAAALLGTRGIIFGRLDKRYLMLGGQRHLLAIAPTRSGKSAGIAIPNLLNWPDSVVVLDMKLELFDKTSGFRRAHGQDVFLFNPFAQDFRTHRWNPLASVRREGHRPGPFTMQDLQAIAGVLYPTGGDAKDQFFANQAQNLFVGLALLVLETPALPFTIPEVLRLSAQTRGDGGFPEYLREALRQRGELSALCRESLNQFLGATGDTLSSIQATFMAPLLVFRNPLVEAATSASDFDVSQLRRKPMTIYLGVSPRDMHAGSMLMTLLVSQVLYWNLGELPERDPALRCELLLLLDEFRVLGRMSVLVDAAGYLAGYGIRLLTILQSQSQLEIYGREGAAAFMTNHGCKVVYAPREERDAKEISEALGTFTEMAESYSRSVGANGGGRLLESRGSLGTNVSAQRRSLLLPQEVKQLPFDTELAFVEGQLPIRASKAYYLGDDAFRQRLVAPVVIPPLVLGSDRDPTSRGDDMHAGPETIHDAQVSDPEMNPALLNLAMECKDPDNPTAEEVARFVDEFTAAMREEPANEIHMLGAQP